MITIEIIGKPVPQKRPRFSRRGNKVCTYDDQATIKEQWQWQIKSQFKEKILNIPLSLDIIYFMTIPESVSNIKKRQMAHGVLSHQKKPDLDNLIKFTLDCLNKIVFQDDSQICEIRAKKIYGTNPSTVIRLIPLTDKKRNLLYENCARESR